MKIRHRKSSGMKYVLLGCGFLLGVVTLWRWHSVSTFRDAQARFISTVTPVLEKMRTYSELDVSFLTGDLFSLSREIYLQPEQYILTKKASFADALTSYNESSSTHLLVESDIPMFLSGRSVEQKIAQLFIFWFEGTELDETMLSLLRTHQPGGVILMGRNVNDQLSGLISTIQSAADWIPFFISVDQEWGQVARVKESLPVQSELSVEEVCPTYLERAELLKSYGINLNFGIIADVTEDPSSFIYARVFRDQVNEKITEAVQCTTETLSTLKHFPGHGITADDSHAGVISVAIDREERETTHLAPFVAGMQVGVDAIMSAHLQVPWMDPVLPVSLSVSGISLLREQGFDGLIVTDDLGMLRADYTEKEAIELSLLAGNDLLLLVNPSDPEKLLTYAAGLVRDGVITREELDSRVERILRAKNKIIKLGRYVPLELVR